MNSPKRIVAYVIYVGVGVVVAYLGGNVWGMRLMATGVVLAVFALLVLMERLIASRRQKRGQR